MRTRLLAAAAIALGTTAGLATPAQATTTGECQLLIADLSSDTAGASSLAAKTQAGLVAKAEAAAAKLDAGKIADALAKLSDYDATLAAAHAAEKPKVSDADFALLDGEVDAALACVGAIA